MINRDLKQPAFSVIVLSYNEERNLEHCLRSISGICEHVFVVDSGSTDRSLEIAERYANVCYHPFETHAKQWAWALSQLAIPTDWVLALDADQQVTPELASELHQLFAGERGKLAGIDGIYIKRRQIFRDKWIKFGGYYPKYLLKLFRRERVRMDPNELVDHHFYVDGRVLKLRHDLIENNRNENDISFWIDKHNRYACLLAAEELKRRSGQRNELIKSSLTGNPDQRTLWLKHLWYRCPAYVRPFLYFVHRYCLRLGFLDGKQGFVFHFLQAFWFRLLVDIKIEELESAARPGGIRNV